MGNSRLPCSDELETDNSACTGAGCYYRQVGQLNKCHVNEPCNREAASKGTRAMYLLLALAHKWKRGVRLE